MPAKMASRRPWITLALWVLLLEVWFEGPLLGRRLAGRGASILLVALLVAAAPVVREAVRRASRLGRHFWLLVGAAGIVATVVRLPAIAAPASLISSDSAIA